LFATKDGSETKRECKIRSVAMGASKSTASAAAVIAPQIEQQSGFNVTVTKDGKILPRIEGATSIEEQIMQSFTAGKEEGLSSIHRSLDSVAAQVYDNIHEQLIGMQKEQLAKLDELVSAVLLTNDLVNLENPINKIEEFT
jgi:hypothetical protein